MLHAKATAVRLTKLAGTKITFTREELTEDYDYHRSGIETGVILRMQCTVCRRTVSRFGEPYISEKSPGIPNINQVSENFRPRREPSVSGSGLIRD